MENLQYQLQDKLLEKLLAVIIRDVYSGINKLKKGVKFEDLKQDQRTAINCFIKSLTEEGGES